MKSNYFLILLVIILFILGCTKEPIGNTPNEDTKIPAYTGSYDQYETFENTVIINKSIEIPCTHLGIGSLKPMDSWKNYTDKNAIYYVSNTNNIIIHISRVEGNKANEILNEMEDLMQKSKGQFVINKKAKVKIAEVEGKMLDLRQIDEQFPFRLQANIIEKEGYTYTLGISTTQKDESAIEDKAQWRAFLQNLVTFDCK